MSAGAPHLHVRAISDFAALEPLREAWNRLVERAHTATIFQTFECQASWWRAYGEGNALRVLLAEASGELVGIAPLYASTARGGRLLQFIGARSFDYADFIVDRDRPDVLPALLESLWSLERRFRLIYLRDVPAESPTRTAVQRFFASRGKPVDARVLYEAPTRVFGDAEADRQLPNKKSLKRHFNHFRKAGRLEFRSRASLDEVMALLDVFFEQHVRRRAVTDTPSLFLDPRAKSFFRELARELAARDWLLFSIVRLDDRPIALHFGFEYGGRITWYKPAFDVDHAKHSPGEVLIKYLLEYALERGVAELDFTIGGEAFKGRFANHRRYNYAVRVFSGRIPYYTAKALLGARSFVERHEALARFARRALQRWRGEPWL
jgi:CelD/BcsL family acetyltransferase involved in cellulose biosynthesis